MEQIVLIPFSFIYACLWSRCFSQQFANQCLNYVSFIVAYQVLRNIVSAPPSILITMSLHFINPQIGQ